MKNMHISKKLSRKIYKNRIILKLPLQCGATFLYYTFSTFVANRYLFPLDIVNKEKFYLKRKQQEVLIISSKKVLNVGFIRFKKNIFLEYS